MTDEEMAEESFKRYRTTDEDYEDLNGSEKLLVFNHEYGAEKQYHRLYKQGFLAGLKAGRPQWHEIESKVTPKREISKQYMPKNKEKVLLKYHFSGDNEIHISDGYYDAYDFEFHIANNPKFRIVCVIAWKEIE